MDLKQLEYFAAIAEEGSVSAAARKLHISQPPLSTQLKALERELGATLAQRGPRRVALTDAGWLLYKRAKQILALADGTVRELEGLSASGSATLRLGTISSSGTALLSRRMADYHRARPGVRFELHEGNTFELLELLHAGVIEAAVVRTPFQAEGLECRYLEPEPMVAVAQGPLLAGLRGGAVPVAALAGLPLIYYRRFDSLLTAVFRREGVSPQVLCRNDDARTTLLWARAGLGVALVPQSAAQLIGGGDLLAKVVDEPELWTQVTAIHRAGAALSEAARAFLDLF